MTDYFDRLEGQLRAAAARQENAARSEAPRRFPRPLRPLLVLGAALALVVPASAAVIEIFEPQREPDGLVRTAPREVIAKGQDPEFGAWEAFISESTAGPCFGVRLIDPPGVLPGSTSEGCGGTGGEPAQVGGGDGPPRTALFGFAPAEAEQVRIEADGNSGRQFPTQPVPSRRGTFFFASLPENPDDLPGLRVVPLGADGKPTGKPIGSP